MPPLPPDSPPRIARTVFYDLVEMAEVVDGRSIVLGPEPVIGAQKVVLRLGDRQLVVGTLGAVLFAHDELQAVIQAVKELAAEAAKRAAELETSKRSTAEIK